MRSEILDDGGVPAVFVSLAAILPVIGRARLYGSQSKTPVVT
jgi:hypothetical protein